jgi:hypothetical protein
MVFQKLYNTPPESPSISPAGDLCLQFRRGFGGGAGSSDNGSPYKAAAAGPRRRRHGSADRLEREGGTLPMETSVLMDDVLSDGMGCTIA